MPSLLMWFYHPSTKNEAIAVKNDDSHCTAGGSKIRVATLNVNGVKGKLDEIKQVCRDMDFDVLGLSETHLEDEEEVKIQGYTWSGRNRDQRLRKGGGVGILVREGIQAHEVEFTEEEMGGEG